MLAPIALVVEAAAAAAPAFDLMQTTTVVPYYNGWDYIFGLTLIVAFLDAFGIGANDVANSFATSVGSGSLTLRQATVIAIFAEFLGAVLVGKTTADTVRNKIVNLNTFKGHPDVLYLGMFCALCGSSLWVLVATRLGLPVSTTHAIVGAIMGIGIAAFGGTGVNWDYDSGGFANIVASWFISPGMAGILAAVLWVLTEYFVLRHEDAYRRSLWTIPFYTFGTVTFIVFFMAYKGLPRVDAEKDMGLGGVVGMSIGIGAGVALLVTVFGLPFVTKWVEQKYSAQQANEAAAANAQTAVTVKSAAGNEERKEQEFTDVEKAMNHGSGPADAGSPRQTQTASTTSIDLMKGQQPLTSSGVQLATTTETPSNAGNKKQWSEMTALERARFVVLHGVDVDVTSHPELSEMHARARKFDSKAEVLYSFLQVLTASFASFAHGSNDIANACGPLATVYAIYSSNHYQYNVTSKNEVPIWVLVFCAVALDIGLATYGYNIMRELGNKITYHSPARGFLMELSAGVSVLFASKQGWPISTTHCITGSTIAIGLVSGDAQSVNWPRAIAYFFAWMVTVPLAGLVAGLVFAVIAFAPKAYTLSTTL